MWINGNGIQVWENVFGIMALWSPRDRQTLRRMNAIWHCFPDLHAPRPETSSCPPGPDCARLFLGDRRRAALELRQRPAKQPAEVNLAIDEESWTYFDVWNGARLNPEGQRLKVRVGDFGCVVGVRQPGAWPGLRELLEVQARSARTCPLPIRTTNWCP